MGDELGIAHARFVLGDIALSCDQIAAARELYHQSLELSGRIGEKGTSVWALRGLAEASRREGDYGSAAELYQRSLALSLEIRERRAIVFVLEGMAAIFAAQGQPERAVALVTAAASMRGQAQLPNGAGVAQRLPRDSHSRPCHPRRRWLHRRVARRVAADRGTGASAHLIAGGPQQAVIEASPSFGTAPCAPANNVQQ